MTLLLTPLVALNADDTPNPNIRLHASTTNSPNSER
jgi:hypothetical protein